jgi:hypothetical protein
MDGTLPAIDVRSVAITDALALHKLDYSFETDRIYALRVNGKLTQNDDVSQTLHRPALAFELWEIPVDPPLYKSFREYEHKLEDVEAKLRSVEGGYVALTDGQIAGAVLLNVEQWRSVTRIEDIIVGRQFRLGTQSLLLGNCIRDPKRQLPGHTILFA